MTSRRWVLTLNNWTEHEYNALMNSPTPTFIILGKEIGASGTPHLQGYLELAKRQSLEPLRNSLNIPRVHLEISRGSQQQAIDYCKKDGDWAERGQKMIQGKRSDLDEVVDRLKSGDTLRQIWENHSKTMILHHRGIEEAYRKLSPNQQKKKKTHPIESFSLQLIQNWEKTQVFWGAPGVGKTCYAVALLPKALIVSHLDDLLNYDEEIHEGIIFDDISILHLPRTAQIHLVDQMLERSIHCRYRTATIPANTKKIFTTNELYGQCMLTEDGAIKRRIEIHEIKQAF